MNIQFDYPDKVRTDFLHDVVKELVQRRHSLGITQDELNHTLGVADRLVSHWECGVRSPTGFHLYCWADALESQLTTIPKNDVPPLIDSLKQNVANDNSCVCQTPVNDNLLVVLEKEIKLKD